MTPSHSCSERKIAMLHDLEHAVLARERQAQAAAQNRTACLRTAHRWQRRAETATRRAQLARLAVG